MVEFLSGSDSPSSCVLFTGLWQLRQERADHELRMDPSFEGMSVFGKGSRPDDPMMNGPPVPGPCEPDKDGSPHCLATGTSTVSSIRSGSTTPSWKNPKGSGTDFRKPGRRGGSSCPSRRGFASNPRAWSVPLPSSRRISRPCMCAKPDGAIRLPTCISVSSSWWTRSEQSWDAIAGNRSGEGNTCPEFVFPLYSHQWKGPVAPWQESRSLLTFFSRNYSGGVKMPVFLGSRKKEPGFLKIRGSF